MFAGSSAPSVSNDGLEACRNLPDCSPRFKPLFGSYVASAKRVHILQNMLLEQLGSNPKYEPICTSRVFPCYAEEGLQCDGPWAILPEKVVGNQRAYR